MAMKIMTNTIYQCSWTSYGYSPVVVLGYLGGSKWKVLNLRTRKETTANTSQLSEVEPNRMYQKEAKTIRVNDEKFKTGSTVQTSQAVSAKILTGKSPNARHALDPVDPRYIASVELKNGTKLLVVRDTDWESGDLSPEHTGPSVLVQLEDGRYAKVPRSRVFPVEMKAETKTTTRSKPATKPKLKLVV